MKRPVHNTNSPNFVKFDFQDFTNIINVFEDIDGTPGGLSEDEKVTLERAKLIVTFMKEKRDIVKETK